jgi:hypothetical protein
VADGADRGERSKKEIREEEEEREREMEKENWHRPWGRGEKINKGKREEKGGR